MSAAADAAEATLRAYLGPWLPLKVHGTTLDSQVHTAAALTVKAAFQAPEPDPAPPPTEFVVVRVHPHCPPGYVPRDLDGRWFTRQMSELPHSVGVGKSATAYATGRLEYRESDGAAAEVYEIPPPGQAGFPERLAWQACDAISYLGRSWVSRFTVEEVAALTVALAAIRREARAEAEQR